MFFYWPDGISKNWERIPIFGGHKFWGEPLIFGKIGGDFSRMYLKIGTDPNFWWRILAVMEGRYLTYYEKKFLSVGLVLC